MNHILCIAGLCLTFIALLTPLPYAQTHPAIDPLTTRTFHVAVKDRIGYMSVTAGLRIVDVSNPAKPEDLSLVVLPQSANYARIDGSVVYVAQGPSGVFVIDVSDVKNPRIMGQLTTPGSAMMLDVHKNRLAVACGSVGVALVDVTTPSDPKVTWSSDSGDYTGYVRGVKFYEDRLFVCAGSAGVRVVEFDESGKGRVTATVATAGDARDIDFYRSTSFVADGAAGVSVVQIAPGGELSLAATYPTEDLAHGVAFHKGFVFVADGLEGVATFEFMRGGALKRGDRLDTQEGYANKVSVFDRKLYVATDFKGMLVFDVHSPKKPVLMD
jgi:hypothetical protein